MYIGKLENSGRLRGKPLGALKNIKAGGTYLGAPIWASSLLAIAEWPGTRGDTPCLSQIEALSS